jgi:type IV secretion system protein VirB1
MTLLSALIIACGIRGQVELLDAIVRVESGGNAIALAVNGAVELVRAPRDLNDAVAMARWLAAHGYNFDAGLAQVNSANLARLGLDTSSVFEPCANLRAASRVLEECHERALQRSDDEERAIAAALSCYNTGHFTRGVRNGYVGAVRASAASSLAPQSIAKDVPETKPGRRRDARQTRSRRAGAVERGQPIGNAQLQDEAFAMAPADVFDASSRGELAQ